MNYKIISSGSAGNCIIINDIMIDCGVAFSKIKEELYNIKYLLITHIHSDHLNQVTLQRIFKKFPTITVIGNYEVHNAAHTNIIANAGFPVYTADYEFMPFKCEHDVLTYGYTWEYNGKKILYCTDTATMDGAPDGEFDYFFLESNHDEDKLKAIQGQRKGTYDPFLSGKRHLSTQAAKAFYYMRRRSNEAEFIELHKSARFY